MSSFKFFDLYLLRIISLKQNESYKYRIWLFLALNEIQSNLYDKHTYIPNRIFIWVSGAIDIGKNFYYGPEK